MIRKEKNTSLSSLNIIKKKNIKLIYCIKIRFKKFNLGQKLLGKLINVILKLINLYMCIECYLKFYYLKICIFTILLNNSIV